MNDSNDGRTASEESHMAMEHALARFPGATRWTAGADRSRLWNLMIEMLGLLAIIVAVPLVVVIDTAILARAMSEHSVTEYLQAALIASATLFFLAGALRMDARRGYLILVATVFCCMLIRESDALLDQVYHGFWLMPALATFVAGLALFWQNRRGQGAAFLDHAETRHGMVVLMGFLMLVVFSRLFGTSAVWENVMGTAYDPAVKATVQEGLELLFYFLIAFGSLLSWRSGFGARDTPAEKA